MNTLLLYLKLLLDFTVRALVSIGYFFIFPFDKLFALRIRLPRFKKPKFLTSPFWKSRLSDIKHFYYVSILRALRNSVLQKMHKFKNLKSERFVSKIKIPRHTFHFKWFSFVLGIIFAIIFIFTPLQIYSWYKNLPKPGLLSELSTRNQATRIVDRKGRLLYEIYVDRKYEPVSLEKIPPHLINATLAVEDSKFFLHNGVRPESMIRALKEYFLDSKLQGASTITQQLIKNVLLTPERTITRKIKEVILAVVVENRYSKEQILELYLNNISYGGTAWGVQSASQKYFGIDVWDLNLAQASILAALPTAPSEYSPFYADPKLYKGRQKLVLDRMVELGYITKEESEEAYNFELKFSSQEEYIRAPHFVAYVRSELNKKFGERYVDFGGLTVKTSLDLDLQEKVEDIVRQEVEKSRSLNISNGAAVVLDARSGEILAYVGSIDYFKDEWGAYDVVTALRQPGSSIKPVTYALALEKQYTPSSVIADGPLTIRAGNDVYTPVNYDGSYHGTVTLRQALANSYNIPAVKVVMSVGVDNMVELGQKMGLTNWTPGDGSYGASVTLGGKEVRLLDLANVYATFARYGMHKDTTSFVSILDLTGNEIYKRNGAEKRVVSEEAAFLISNILSDNVARSAAFGLYSYLRIPYHTVAVKTGTTDLKRDNWTFGYTPSYVAGVWVGNNDNTPMNSYLASGISGAAPIWNKVIKAVLGESSNEEFKVPSNMIFKFDKECKRSEYFIKGKAPLTLCPDKADTGKKEQKEKKKRDND